MDFPDNNFISFGETPEIEYLKDVGVLKRSNFIVLSSNGGDGDLFSRIQVAAFKNNNELEKGYWSLAQPNRELILNKESSELTRNLEVELYECLPIPSPEVSLEDILHFKERRKDELLEFRRFMDNLYLK
ncbi:DUF6236 family protein [Metabacillus sp. DBTR6]|uniref:DUF6236 family protein n=1 Tax=Metabacillus rhizolycopersici TaxID=2875709 RepID=A0ABS7UWS1_9BACI|nr:DUF6236 family protein [Metabacillus rhizolycopersici]